jgi:hypothetical protein
MAGRNAEMFPDRADITQSTFDNDTCGCIEVGKQVDCADAKKIQLTEVMYTFVRKVFRTTAFKDLFAQYASHGAPFAQEKSGFLEMFYSRSSLLKYCLCPPKEYEDMAISAPDSHRMQTEVRIGISM